MEIYLDNSATTRCFEEVAEVVNKVMLEDYGNPSSMHLKGVDAEKYIRRTKEILARSMKVKEKEIYFTSGGTESDNMALIGAALANRRAGQHLITTRIEHPAILQTMQFLETLGFEVTYLPVDGEGRIDPEHLSKEIRDDTTLVSIMHTNNEIGTLEPIEEVGIRIKEKNPRTLFHVDAIQGYGKFRILPGKMKIDMLSVSGHKIHAPKGIGFLYIRENVKVSPIILGGGQQKGMRSGTENVPGIAGLGEAVKKIYQDLEETREHLYALKERLTEGIRKLPDVRINGPEIYEGAPHIVSASFLGIRSEVLLHALEDKGIFVSAGSACATNKADQISATLKAIGLDANQIESTVRFSLSGRNTVSEIDYTLQTLYDIVPLLRKYVRS